MTTLRKLTWLERYVVERTAKGSRQVRVLAGELPWRSTDHGMLARLQATSLSVISDRGDVIVVGTADTDHLTRRIP